MKNTYVQFERLCPVCKNSSGEFLYALNSLFFDGFSIPRKRNIVSCGQCGFHFVDAAYTNEILSEYYKKYFSVIRSTEGNIQDKMQKIHYKRVIDKIIPYLNVNNKKSIHICDVGCGKGHFLSSFYEYGFSQLTGIDYCDNNFESSNDSKFNYICSDICDLQLSQKQDVMLCSHVLEHLLHVKPAIEGMYNNINHGGILYIEVPDFDEIYLEDTVINSGIIEHTNRFTHFQIGKILTETGFCVREIFNLTIGEDISSLKCLCVIAEKCQDISEAILMKPLYTNQALSLAGKFNFRIDWELLEFIDTDRPIYVWGITYYTFEIISRTLLHKCNIVAFVDRSPARQKETINGMCISPPEIINNAPSDSGIVLCMAYGAESVALDLRDKGYKGKIIRFPYHHEKNVIL